MKRNRATDGNPRQCYRCCGPNVIEQCCDIVCHRVDGELAPHLLRHAGAPAVIAQHPTRVWKPWRDVVPAFDRTAHFVHQHQRALTLAAYRVAQGGTVQFNEFRLRSQRLSA